MVTSIASRKLTRKHMSRCAGHTTVAIVAVIGNEVHDMSILTGPAAEVRKAMAIDIAAVKACKGTDPIGAPLRNVFVETLPIERAGVKETLIPKLSSI